MPQFCAAFGCTNKRTVETKARGITFHKFPSNPDKQHAWEVAMKRDGFKSTKYSVICSDHFRSEDFDRTGQTVRLRDDVVPSIFNFPQHLVKVVKPRSTATSTQAAAAATVDPATPMETSCESPLQSSVSLPRDHMYALPESPGSLKRKLVERESRVTELERKLRNATDRERRTKKSVKSLLSELKDKNLLNEELEHKLEMYSDLPMDVLGKKGLEYSTRQREFALTLHLHGSKAYKYLRETLNLPLPHPHTLQRWLRSVDSKPGFNTQLLDVLKQKAKEDPNNYGRVCLMLDAMAIKKQVVYDSCTQCMRGFVDLGDGPDEENVASEALVFMVNGVKGHWKAPIAYFFTRTLTPSTQKVLIEHALVTLHEHGIQVICLVMDGHASNVSMCSMLGCALKFDEPLVTYFPHPSTSQRVYVMMDACHMLKLVRNMLQAYSTLHSPDGVVSWHYIASLHDIQQREGLHAANKLSHKHILFEAHKMKVSLAAQTMSRSVATALLFVKDSGYAGFEDCLPTVKFIELIDQLFDVMNSRNPVGRWTKAPLSLQNWTDTVTFLRQAIQFLKSLARNDGTPLYRTRSE